MEKLISIYDHTTGETIVREMNDEELAQYEIEIEESKQRKLDALAKIEAKSALLEKLGINQDEAKLLLS